MKEFLLGIDVGTSSCKVTLFYKNGETAASASSQYDVSYPREGWAQQEPDDWWNGICRALKKMWEASHVNPHDIAAIGVSGQSWSAVAVDENGNVLCPSPIWTDTRSAEICKRISDKIGEDRIFNLCGNTLNPTYTTGKVVYMKENAPEKFEKTRYILQSNSYIVYRLTGEISQDVSQGYGWHCYDMKNARWDEQMAELLEIPLKLLPPIFSCESIVGEVNKEAALVTGLAMGTPVVAGGLDAACATLGAGVIEDGQTQEQGGQAGGMSICTNRVCADPRLILGAHVVPGRWLLQGGTVGGGGVMNWLEREFAISEREYAAERGASSFEQLDMLAADIAPGCDGMIFLPYMAGERTPIWDPKAKGVFYGLDFSKTRGHMIRAGMEGVAFSLRHNLDIAEQAGAHADVLCSTGGAANSKLWTQIKADVTGKTIVVPSSDTASSWGAAILAGVGCGMFSSFEEAVKNSVKHVRRHEPDRERMQIYSEAYETYLKLYPALKDIMHRGK